MICYHHNDLDGKGAANAVHEFGTRMHNFHDTPGSYYQCTYESEFNKHHRTDNVYIVDLSFTESNINKLINVCKTANSVTWIDHHLSSLNAIKMHEDKLQKIKNLTYFVSDCACGAALAYAYFLMPIDMAKEIRNTRDGEKYCFKMNMDEEKRVIQITGTKYNENGIGTVRNHSVVIPEWLHYIDDYDCWKKKDPDTDYFILGCDKENTSFTIYDKVRGFRFFNTFWSNIMDDSNIDDTINEGKIIHKYIHSRYYRELRNTFEWEHDHTTFICKNGTGNSWCFEELIQKYEAVILFYYDGSCAKWKYSVFADAASKFDCKRFAESFGGGGHFHAAGFSTDTLIFTNPSITYKPSNNIFLGGTCNNDPWREEFISKWNKLKNNDPVFAGLNNINLFNPVVEEWTEEAKKKENEIKSNAFMNLFVITPSMLGVFSIAEAVESSHRKNCKTVFIVYDKFNTSFNKDDPSKAMSSLDATGKLIESNGGTYLKFSGENSCEDMVKEVAKLCI